MRGWGLRNLDDQVCGTDSEKGMNIGMSRLGLKCSQEFILWDRLCFKISSGPYQNLEGFEYKKMPKIPDFSTILSSKILPSYTINPKHLLSHRRHIQD